MATTGQRTLRIAVWLPGRPPSRGGHDDQGRLTGHGVRVILKRLVQRAGLDPDKIRPHSLRANGATGAYLGGADPIAITRHGGWADGSNVVFGSIRNIDRWTKNPMHGAGL